MMRYRPIVFPKDELKHKTLGEWWYFNGNLTDKSGHRYSYMNCLFRARVSFAKRRGLRRIPARDVFFYHTIVTDIDRNKSYRHIDPIVVVSRDSFNSDLLNIYFTSLSRNVRYSGYYIEEPEPFFYRIKGDKLCLSMQSQKKPLFEGGNGYVKNFGKATYYYSLTDLKTRGCLAIDGKNIEVEGRSWMDHQWADTPINGDVWNWFSLQLDDGTDIVCYEYVLGGKSVCLATILSLDSTQTTHSGFTISRLDQSWQSEKNNVEYPTAWKIEIPAAGISLEVKSEVTDHEINFLYLSYWESPIVVTGTIRSRAVEGVGYMELVGKSQLFEKFQSIKRRVQEKASIWRSGKKG